jgi:hypothetical protein
MSEVEFVGFPSLARLNRDMTITEKIDGTNAGVHVTPLIPYDDMMDWGDDRGVVTVGGSTYRVTAQSRKRLIYPGDDNFGFASWVEKNGKDLAKVLGEGLHFGEWWGSGVQRGYGLTKGERRFSLFNTLRWRDTNLSEVEGLGMVPELFVGSFSTNTIETVKYELQVTGSQASKGFMNPEGLVVFHHASRSAYKTTYDDCDDYGHGGGKTWTK